MSRTPPPATVPITTKDGNRAWTGRNSPAHIEAAKEGREGHTTAPAAEAPTALIEPEPVDAELEPAAKRGPKPKGS